MARFLSLALGALALISTTATLVTQAVLSIHIDHYSPGRTASIVSAILEAFLLVPLFWLCAPIFFPSISAQSKRQLGIVFGLGVLVCTLATGASIIALAYTRKTEHKTPMSIVTACAVLLVLSFPSQLTFLILHFLTARTDTISTSWSFHKDEENGRRSRKINLKAIRYSQTLPIMNQSQRNTLDMQPLESPRSISGYSTVDTIRVSLGSVTHVIRPASSMSKLLPSKEFDRGVSMESNTNRSSGGDTFDSWDTSAVDVHNRQAVLEISSPTLPKPPAASKQFPPAQRLAAARLLIRCLILSPLVCEIGAEATALSEAHIHPLFRSDSPDPHPMATPGTIVVAAPDAGRVIVHRASNRSLNRMRSGSLPKTPSPLSKQGGLEDGQSPVLQQQGELSIITGTKSEEPEPETPRPQTERKMTPPVPEWLLSGRAGTRYP
ncbi:hypothetical protein PT974_08455 [Cladobotryum mycophilum]|uniref:Uncharacterized protein n=1 Tax=Cladobotryum mycophilum TaxID=491253 RepID=A0ABR0SDH5_9HYPO